jgi:uncharacterized membrane protein YdjX (TVP38/TMEM64 family)
VTGWGWTSGARQAACRPGGRRWLPLLLLAPAVAVFFAAGLGRYLSWEAFRDNRQWLLDEIARLGFLAPVVFIAVYATVAALSVPGGAVLTLAGGFLFGTWPGALYALIGATIGGSILFGIARTSIGDLLRARTGPALRRVEAGFREDAVSYLLFLRLVPVFPFWLVNLVSAFFGANLRVFMLCSFIGMAPGSLVYASLGAGAATLAGAGEAHDLHAVVQWRVLGPLVALAALALAPVAYKRLKARAGQPAP